LAKATVQAALASAPLDLIVETKSDDEDFLRWQGWGKDIVTTSIFAIILTAPTGLLFIHAFGEKWLTQDNVHIKVVPICNELSLTSQVDSFKQKLAAQRDSFKEKLGPDDSMLLCATLTRIHA
jgi:hypothetical protein